MPERKPMTMIASTTWIARPKRRHALLEPVARRRQRRLERSRILGVDQLAARSGPDRCRRSSRARAPACRRCRAGSACRARARRASPAAPGERIVGAIGALHGHRVALHRARQLRIGGRGHPVEQREHQDDGQDIADDDRRLAADLVGQPAEQDEPEQAEAARRRRPSVRAAVSSMRSEFCRK